MIPILRVLVITLYSGENEYEKASQKIRAQNYPSIEHKVIAFKANCDAHRELYNTIENLSDQFDVFIKLDADMVLRDENTIADIVSEFSCNGELDHAVFCVRDWASQTEIMGLHAFSNRVSWMGNEEKLFVDRNPTVSGYRELYWTKPAPVANHMPDPDHYQAYLFGFHRALKIVQRGRVRINVGQICFQYFLLENVWLEFEKSEDSRRRLILIGAEDAFRSRGRVLEKKGWEHQISVSALTEKYPVSLLGKRWSRELCSHRRKKLYWVCRGRLLSTPVKALGKTKRTIVSRFGLKKILV